ncbi:NAD(P)-binding protein [Coccomyxa subellipsoidea C-169]|uniref:NAD(P)-binding protein n=1 Tax=Coccomyxa subellipsoidea (strain C-169) TaxID=574566 RepID=I0Z121_COCSC|nr:NAD(P)-binding protein [Coccomyxa subellipsoidea C-169]EIE24340.1 NAD(P)-binding protein [Coccomyxa subellipsoidea C-169]|eukprot:XP_005648884.1 NAD(P)-binding protein [Coccomyxa subellipsoidea C-169]
MQQSILGTLPSAAANSAARECPRRRAQRLSHVQPRATASVDGQRTVPKNSVLVVGGTGTLGRQVVRRALDEGYEVRCIVRPRQNPADFLRDWGATTVQADLQDPTSLPAALVGIHTVIDCSTARPEESTQKIDWEGKVALMQCAQAMGIQRYVFFSIHNAERHPEVPLMLIKSCSEKFLENSGLDYTIFRLCGFMQAIIGNYAVPILEDRQVWGTSDQTQTAYLDSQDVAKMTLAALRSDSTIGRTLTLAGPKAWTVPEVIALCEKYADERANVTEVPVWLLKATRSFLKSFQWARDAADRLAFADILASNENFSAPMEETYKLLDLNPADTTTLEDYLQEYYTSILKKLKQVGASSRQTDFYV